MDLSDYVQSRTLFFSLSYRRHFIIRAPKLAPLSGLLVAAVTSSDVFNAQLHLKRIFKAAAPVQFE